MSSEVETDPVALYSGSAAAIASTSLGDDMYKKMKFSVNWLREFVDLPEKPGRDRRIADSRRD